MDVPKQTESFIVEVAQDDGPWGARGIGEHSMVPGLPAIANAIYDAVGVRLDPPFTAEKIFMALQKKKSEKPETRSEFVR
jgi:carbon-monoxide dehydrogenase large subunit